MKTLLHVNYYEGAGRLDELISLAVKFGYDGVELRWKYKFPDLTQTEYQNRVAAYKSRYPELEFVFGGMVSLCRGDDATVAAELAAYLEFLEWAKKQCGTCVMNFFTGSLLKPDTPYFDYAAQGSGMATEADYQRSAAGLRTVGARAAELGILIALETHNNYLHDLAAPSRKLLDLTGCDAVGLNYDQGNILINPKGESIERFFELVGDKVYYAHLKNLLLVGGTDGRPYMGCRLSDGHINTMKVMRLLAPRLRSGMFAVEFPNSGDGIYAAKLDIEYIRFIKEYLQLC